MATASPAFSEQRALSGIQKAAILMLSVDPEAGAAVLKRLAPAEVELLSRAIANLGPVSAESAAAVLQEFSGNFADGGVMAVGDAESSGHLLTSAFGAEYARQLQNRLEESSRFRSPHLDLIVAADPEAVAVLLASESAQSTAVLLANLDQDSAARVLDRLPENMQSEVLIRMADLGAPDPELLSSLAQSVASRINGGGGGTATTSSGGLRRVADVLNRLQGDAGERVLSVVEASSPDVASSIRQMMFPFDDILKLDTKAMRELVSRIDRKLLVVGLKGTSDQLRKHFLGVLSKNGAAMLLEDMEAAGPVRLCEVEEAQTQIIAALRAMEQEGVVSLKGGGAEQYVV